MTFEHEGMGPQEYTEGTPIAINEQHRVLNGQLRERVTALEAENKRLWHLLKGVNILKPRCLHEMTWEELGWWKNVQDALKARAALERGLPTPATEDHLHDGGE